MAEPGRLALTGTRRRDYHAPGVNRASPNVPRPTSENAMSELTHFDESGAARMVDTSAKAETVREAKASALVRMAPATLALIRQGAMAKGDVLGVARLAGIMAAKRT